MFERSSNATEKRIYLGSYRKHRQRLLNVKPYIQSRQARNSVKPSSSSASRKSYYTESHSQTGSYALRRRINVVQTQQFTENNQDQVRNRKPKENQDFAYLNRSNQDFPVKFMSISNSKPKIRRQEMRNRLNSAVSNKISFQKQKFELKTLNNTHKEAKIFFKQTKQSFTKMYDQTDELERNEKRQIIFKKTIILQSMQSALLQFSLLSQRLLIVAYLMGKQNYNIKILLKNQQSKQLLQQYSDNFQQLSKRIYLAKRNDRYQIIKIKPKQLLNHEINKTNEVYQREAKSKEKQHFQSKYRFKIQQEFIKRNHDNYVAAQKINMVAEQEEKLQKKSISKKDIKRSIEKLIPLKSNQNLEETSLKNKKQLQKKQFFQVEFDNTHNVQQKPIRKQQEQQFFIRSSQKSQKTQQKIHLKNQNQRQKIKNQDEIMIYDDYESSFQNAQNLIEDEPADLKLLQKNIDLLDDGVYSNDFEQDLPKPTTDNIKQQKKPHEQNEYDQYFDQSQEQILEYPTPPRQNNKVEQLIYDDQQFQN